MGVAAPAPDARILVVRLSSFGDVVFCMPAVERLRRALPDAHLTWVVEDRAAEILQGNPALDELVVMPRRDWRRLRRERGRLAAFAAMRSFARDLRRRRFDVAVDFQGNLKSGLVTRASGAPRRLGFGRGELREPNWLFTNERLDLPGPPRHRIERDLALLRLLEIDPEFLAPRVHCPEGEAREVDRIADEAAAGGPLVVLVPGTSAWFAAKRWAPERLAAVGRRLAEERGCGVLVSWGPGEEGLRDAVLAGLGDRGRAVERPLTVKGLARLAGRSDLVIGADTGPVHLAATLGAPTLALFGPYDPRLYHPWGRPDRALYSAVPCSPCRYRDCPRPVCMETLEVDAVLAAARAALDDAPPGPPAPPPRKTVAV